jgi:hypothetical protein
MLTSDTALAKGKSASVKLSVYCNLCNGDEHWHPRCAVYAWLQPPAGTTGWARSSTTAALCLFAPAARPLPFELFSLRGRLLLLRHHAKQEAHKTDMPDAHFV